jgi:hypothetical protein
MATKQYNNLSPKLREHLPKLNPGDKVRFQLLGVYTDPITRKFICPRSSNIKPVDRIYDPWAHERKVGGKVTYEGDYVDISYIIREVPAPKDSLRDSVVEFGEITFMNSDAGMIEIQGGRLEEERRLLFLFFSNSNASNVGKPWYIKPVSKSKYKMLAPNAEAKKTLEREAMVDRARSIIMNMTPEEVTEAARGLFPNKYYSLGNDERIMELREIAATHPEKILNASKDVDTQAVAFIERLLTEKIIAIDDKKHQWIWADDKTKICTINDNSAPHNALKRYFMTDEGRETLSTLEGILGSASKNNGKSDSKEKTAKTAEVKV